MKLIPLLILSIAIFAASLLANAETESFEASTVVEATVSGTALESTLGGGAAESGLSSAASFDPSILLVLFLGLVGLFWMRHHVQSL